MKAPQARHALILLATVAGFLVATGAGPAPRAAAADPPPDGLTSRTAAASCWEIKQNVPSSADGVYWLVTPTLIAPQQFYCDMTTDGGGWVLIGRGREGWVTTYEGKGSAAELRTTVTGPGAFVVRQLSVPTVNGLLDGQRPDALTDQVRVRRALNSAGTDWQEARFGFARRDSWRWTLDAENPVSTWRLGTTTGTGGLTNVIGLGNGTARMQYTANRAYSGVRGFAYGGAVLGNAAADSHLWTPATGQGAAIPFAQVFVRPRLRLADLTFPTVPDSGTAVSERRPLLENFAQPNTWGVTGLANGVATELTTEVAAFAQVGSTVFVGGNFRFVQKGPNATGADKVEQSYLAAFDAATGDWIPGFRPVFNNQVKALAALPNGTLVVGGEFTTANGAHHERGRSGPARPHDGNDRPRRELGRAPGEQGDDADPTQSARPGTRR
jgi:trimeric autotransporter adhesin